MKTFSPPKYKKKQNAKHLRQMHVLSCSVVATRPVPALRFVVWPPPVFACTVVFRHDLRAPLALHRAAPVEFAFAAADHLDALLHHPEAALVAQPAAALPLPHGHVLVPLQTLAAFRALVLQALVLDAVIRRLLQVDKLCLGDAAESVRNGSPVVRVVARPHGPLVHLQFLGLLVLQLQVVAHLSEVGQLHPARLDAAAPRHAVALAGSPQCSFDGLKKKIMIL